MKNVVSNIRPDNYSYQIPNEENYIAALLTYMYKRQDHYFLNDSIGHATLLADMMIGAAEKYVLIYTGSFNEQCYKYAVDNLPDSVKVRVLFQDNSAKRWWTNNQNIIAHNTSIPLSLNGNEINHFFVVDGKAFRYEIDHLKSTASANFSQPEVCEGLTSIFSEAWGNITNNQLDL